MSDQIEPTDVVDDSSIEVNDAEPVLNKEALRQKIRDNLMNGATDTQETTTEDEVVDPEVEVVDEVVDDEPSDTQETNEEVDEVADPEVEDDSDEVVDPEVEDDDFDLDEDPDVDEFDEEEEQDDDLDKNIVALRKKHTELKEKYQAQEETLTKTIEELDKTKDELEKYTLTQIDPKSHPDFLGKSEATANSIYSGLVRLKGLPDAADKLGDKWGDILTEVSRYEETPRAEKAKSLADLRLSIANNLGMVDGDTLELDARVDGDAIDAADKVIDVFERHTGNYQELSDIYTRIQSKAADKSLEIGYDEYQMNTKSVSESLSSIDTMSDKDIDEDPNSLQAMAARKITSSPELKTRSAKIDKMLVELAFGPEALSQAELDRHAKSGKDMGEFQQARNERVTALRNKYIPQFKSMLMLLPQIKKALPEYFEAENKSAKIKAQKQAVRKSTKKQPREKVEDKNTTLTKESLRENLRKNLRL